MPAPLSIPRPCDLCEQAHPCHCPVLAATCPCCQPWDYFSAQEIDRLLFAKWRLERQNFGAAA